MPAPAVDFRIEGLSDLERNLLDMAEEFGPRNARRSLNIPMRNAFRIVEAAIRTDTPVDTGRLRELTRVQTGNPSRFDLADTPDAVWVARAGWFWTSPSFYSFRALAVEYGTRSQTGQSVLRRSLERNIPQVLSVLGRELGDNIERTANRLAARQRSQGSAFRRR